MKVENLTSSNGNKIANQFRIEHRGEIFFQSYESIIVKIDKKGRVFFRQGLLGFLCHYTEIS